jgi:hypothetical protein
MSSRYSPDRPPAPLFDSADPAIDDVAEGALGARRRAETTHDFAVQLIELLKVQIDPLLGNEGIDHKHGPEALPRVQVLGVEPVAPGGDRGLHHERVPEGELGVSL